MVNIPSKTLTEVDIFSRIITFNVWIFNNELFKFDEQKADKKLAISINLSQVVRMNHASRDETKTVKSSERERGGCRETGPRTDTAVKLIIWHPFKQKLQFMPN